MTKNWLTWYGIKLLNLIRDNTPTMKMKTLALSMLITGAVCAHGQSLQQSAAGTTVLTPYQVVAAGPHERVWMPTA